MSTRRRPGSPTVIVQLRDALRQFARDRDWEQFHSPKNLAIALSVEAAELLEHFQWTADGSSARLSEKKRVAVSEELADVLLYLIMISDQLDIDLVAAAREKLAVNARKYPADEVRGSCKKYSET